MRKRLESIYASHIGKDAKEIGAPDRLIFYSVYTASGTKGNAS